MSGKQVLIVRGRGGRPDLGDALQARGAQLDYLEVYERRLPEVAKQGVLDLTDPPVDAVVCTSNEMLENLVQLVAPAQRQRLFELQLFVLSERASSLAQQLGFKHPALITQNATQAAIVNALAQWAQPT